MTCVAKMLWPKFIEHRVLVQLCRAHRRRGVIVHPLRYMSSSTSQEDNLDALLKAIDSVNTNEADAADAVASQKRPARDERVSRTRGADDDSARKQTQSSKAVTSTSTNDQSQMCAKHIQEALLQSQLRSAQQELTFLQLKLSNLNQFSSCEQCVPAESAQKPLSSSELIAEKSPQHFIKDTNSNEQLAQSPQLQNSGCVASISLVGRVVTDPSEVRLESSNSISARACTSGGDRCSSSSSICNSVSDASTFLDDADTSSVDFAVEYEIPFTRSSKTTRVLVRCYGSTLGTFALDCVKRNDIVHVLGSLIPLHCKQSNEHTAAVCVLPVGGNISVVLSHNYNNSCR